MAPMVVSVHSIVGLDFAAGIIAGWHSTQWPPYFFIGALYSGWAVVLVARSFPCAGSMRSTDHHRAASGGDREAHARDGSDARLLLPDGGDGRALLGRAGQGRAHSMRSAFGHYGATFWARNTLNIFIPQLLWFPAMRRNHGALGCIRSASSRACGSSATTSSSRARARLHAVRVEFLAPRSGTGRYCWAPRDW